MKNGITSGWMMGTSSELQYTCLARYEKRTGFDECEPSGNYYFVIWLWFPLCLIMKFQWCFNINVIVYKLITCFQYSLLEKGEIALGNGITAVPIEEFRKMLISSFANVEKLEAYSYTRKELWTLGTNTAAMTSKFEFQYYTDQWFQHKVHWASPTV